MSNLIERFSNAFAAAIAELDVERYAAKRRADPNTMSLFDDEGNSAIGKKWDEKLHPRAAAGSEHTPGGRFVKKEEAAGNSPEKLDSSKPAGFKPQFRGLSSQAIAHGKTVMQKTGKHPHELSLSEFTSVIDPTNSRWQIGTQDEKLHEEWISQALVYHPDSIPDEVLNEAAKKGNVTAQNERALREESKPTSSPGLIMPETTVDNSKAKSGDQLGLFGEATKAKVADKPFVPTLLGKGEQTKAKQHSMFETMGHPDQMNLFSDGSEPDGMVKKPVNDSKNAPHSEEKPVEPAKPGTKIVIVGEFRNKTDRVGDAVRSVSSAPNQKSRSSEMEMLRRIVDDVKNTTSKRASQSDLERHSNVIKRAQDLLDQHDRGEGGTGLPKDEAEQLKNARNNPVKLDPKIQALFKPTLLDQKKSDDVTKDGRTIDQMRKDGLSEDQIQDIESNENYFNVIGDPSKASDADLNRAHGHAGNLAAHHERNGRKDMADSIMLERAAMKAEIKRRNEGPKDGDRDENGLVFRNGRWHRDEEPKDINAMTADELSAHIASKPVNGFSTSRQEDWGSGRGQGKRMGGMVKGAMSDPPKGIKTYIDRFGKLPKEEQEEIAGLQGGGQNDYARARNAGLSHDDAMVWAYEQDGEVEPGFTHKRMQEAKDAPQSVAIPEEKPTEPTKPVSKSVSVGEFRNSMDRLGDVVRSVSSAANQSERGKEMERLRRVLGEVKDLTSSRASASNVDSFKSIVGRAQDLIAAHDRGEGVSHLPKDEADQLAKARANPVQLDPKIQALFKPKLLDQPKPEVKPAASDDKSPIPFRDRKSFAQKMAADGKTHSEIVDAMTARGVAAVDARRNASNALGDVAQGVVAATPKEEGPKESSAAKLFESRNPLPLNDGHASQIDSLKDDDKRPSKEDRDKAIETINDMAKSIDRTMKDMGESDDWIHAELQWNAGKHNPYEAGLHYIGKISGVAGRTSDGKHGTPTNADVKKAVLRSLDDMKYKWNAFVDKISKSQQEREAAKAEPEEPKEEPKSEEPKESPTDDRGNEFAPGVSYRTISKSTAMAAHRGTSFSPEKRGEQRQRDFAHEVNEVYANLKKSAKGDQTKLDILSDEWDRFLSRAKDHYNGALHSDSRIMSTMIAGASNFPVRRMEKANQASRNKWDGYINHMNKGEEAIFKKMHPELAPKKIGDADTGDHIATELERRQKEQQHMKDVNKILQTAGVFGYNREGLKYKSGHTEASTIEKLAKLDGVTEEQAKRLVKPDIMNHVGYASYSLTNNNAAIRRYEQQAKRQQKFETEAKAAESAGEQATSHDFDGGKVHLDYDDNRIRIAHDSKPGPDVIAKLKSNGFRWSPQNKAWQRQLTNAAKYAVHSITGVPLDKLTPKQEAKAEAKEEQAPPDRKRDYWKNIESGLNVDGKHKLSDGTVVSYGEGKEVILTHPDGTVTKKEITPELIKKAGTRYQQTLARHIATEYIKTKYSEDSFDDYETDRYSDDDDLRYDITPEDQFYAAKYSVMRSLGIEVDRYTLYGVQDAYNRKQGIWDESKHPRAQKGNEHGGQFTKGSGGGSGGAFPNRQGYARESAKAIEGIQSYFGSQAKPAQQSSAGAPAPSPAKPVAPRPTPMAKPAPTPQPTPQKPTRKPPTFGPRVDVDHHLHASNLPRDIQSSHRTNLNALHEALGFDWRHAKTDEEFNQAFSKVDKPRLQAVLQQFNDLDKASRAKGIAYSDFVNAEQSIPPQLAKRLSGGSRFFDRDKIAHKMNKAPKGFTPKINKEQHQAQLADELLKAIAPEQWNKKNRQASANDADLASRGGIKGGLKDPPKKEAAPKPYQPAVKPMEAPAPKPEPTPDPVHEIAGISKIASSKLNKAIEEMIGNSNPAMIADFRSIAEDAHRDMVQQAQEHNEALSVLAAGRSLGGNVAWARNTSGDAATKKNFDTAFEEAANRWPHLFSGDDKEADAMDLLKKGKMQVPSIYDQAVINKAIDMAGPQFFSYYDDAESDGEPSPLAEYDAMPFSWIACKVRIDRYRHWAWVERYTNERQMSFNWDEQSHPRQPKGSESGGEFAKKNDGQQSESVAVAPSYRNRLEQFVSKGLSRETIEKHRERKRSERLEEIESTLDPDALEKSNFQKEVALEKAHNEAIRKAHQAYFDHDKSMYFDHPGYEGEESAMIARQEAESESISESDDEDSFDKLKELSKQHKKERDELGEKYLRIHKQKGRELWKNVGQLEISQRKEMKELERTHQKQVKAVAKQREKALADLENEHDALTSQADDFFNEHEESSYSAIGDSQSNAIVDRYKLLTFEELDKFAKNFESPTKSQAEAGNYCKAHINFQGLQIAIETPKGKRRKPQYPPMAAHYGDIKRTTGSDGDPVDVFIGPHADSLLVFVIDQPTKEGEFDEHKCMLGFYTEENAVETYRKCYTPDWKVGPVTTMTIAQFKNWLKDGKLTMPIEKQVSRYSQANRVERYLETSRQLARSLAGVKIDRYEWKEEDHPRGQPENKGQFVENSGLTKGNGRFAERQEKKFGSIANNPWGVFKNGVATAIWNAGTHVDDSGVTQSVPYEGSLIKVDSDSLDPDNDDDNLLLAIEDETGESPLEYRFEVVRDVNNPFGLTGMGNAKEVIEKASAVLLHAIHWYSPKIIYYTAQEQSRTRLYRRLSAYSDGFKSWDGHSYKAFELRRDENSPTMFAVVRSDVDEKLLWSELRRYSGVENLKSQRLQSAD